jgi:hypothetical protein
VICLPPCPITAYAPVRKAIKVMPDLEKYDIGADGNKDLPFAFDHTPLSCGYYKRYTKAAIKKLHNTDDSTPFITIVWHNTTPYLRVHSVTIAHDDHYIVTIKSKLYDESIYTPEIKFEIYMHVHKCIHATLGLSNPLELLNTKSPFKIDPHSYRIAYLQTAQNREFVNALPTVAGCDPIKYEMTTPEPKVLALMRPGGTGFVILQTSPKLIYH